MLAEPNNHWSPVEINVISLSPYRGLEGVVITHNEPRIKGYFVHGVQSRAVLVQLKHRNISGMPLIQSSAQASPE